MNYLRILLLACFVFSVHFSDAQEPVARDGPDMVEKLDLSEEQEQKIRAINRDIADSLRKVTSKYSDNQEAKMEAIRRINRKRNERYKEVLSGKQWKKCCEIRGEKDKTSARSGE